MARFLTTKGCLAEIESVITSARQRLVLITPFVQLTDDHARRLHDAASRGVTTVLVCRHASLKPDVQAFFASLDGCEVSAFVAAMQEALKQLKGVPVRRSALVKRLFEGGAPATPAQIRARLDDFLAELADGTDANNVRILLEE